MFVANGNVRIIIRYSSILCDVTLAASLISQYALRACLYPPVLPRCNCYEFQLSHYSNVFNFDPKGCTADRDVRLNRDFCVREYFPLDK